MTPQSHELTVSTNHTCTIALQLQIEEPNVVCYLRGFEDDTLRREKAVEALKVGVIAIRSASPTLDTTVVQEKFTELEDKMKIYLSHFMEEVEGQLTGYFKEHDGVLPKSINGVFGDDGKLGRTFQQFFDPTRGSLSQLMQQQIGPTSVFGRALDPKNKEGILTQIETRVQKLVEVKLEEVLSQFSLDNDESAMCRMNKLLTDSFAKIHLTLGMKAAAAAEAERGHVKGMEFEANLYDVFAEVGRRVGDETENVRGTPGTLRKKTGDYVAMLGDTTGAPGARLTVEVKDQPVKLKAAIEELQEAKRNRDATIGIFVFAKGCEPAEVGDFRRIGEDFYCTVDKEHLVTGVPLMFFDAAYQVARALAVASARKEAEDSLDMQKLKDHVDALISVSERLSEVTTKARTVKSSGDAIEKAAESLKKELDTRLSAMQAMLVSR